MGLQSEIPLMKNAVQNRIRIRIEGAWGELWAAAAAAAASAGGVFPI